MSRTVTAPVAAAVAAVVTEPGYLVEILFDTPLHFSSRGDVDWSGQTWTAWNIKISGLVADSDQSTQNGQLTLGNTVFDLGVVILSEGIVDRPIHIWKFYGEVPAAADPVMVFYGVGADVTIDPTAGNVVITLAQSGGKSSYSPRRYITAEQGFSFLPAAGQAIPWAGELFILQAGTGNG